MVENGWSQSIELEPIFGRTLIKTKIYQTNHQQTDLRKYENNATHVSKWNRNRCTKPSQINAKTGNGKDHEHYIKQIVFRYVITCKFIVKTMVFEVVCQTRNNIKHSSKMIPKSISKSMKQQSKTMVECANKSKMEIQNGPTIERQLQTWRFRTWLENE